MFFSGCLANTNHGRLRLGVCGTVREKTQMVEVLRIKQKLLLAVELPFLVLFVNEYSVLFVGM